jgi:REP element-mobilizing transposase RayT
MPRRPRVFVEGGIYHVYNRFARGAELFADPEEAIEFLEILRKARDRDGLTVFAWALMPNHYHMALRAGPVPLSRTMGYVQARFGQRFNRRHRSSGPRWQSRYKARMVEDPRYLDRLIIYIHLNPVVAGLVDDPADHPFSGHRELLGKVKQPLIDVDTVLAAFGETVRTARRAYVRALKGARQEEWRGEKSGRFQWWRHEVDRPVEPVAPAAWVDELGRSTGLERPRMSPADFLSRSSALLGTTAGAIAGPGKGREISRKRYIIAALGIERWGIPVKALAQLVGRMPEAVSRWGSRGAEMRQESEEFRQAYEKLDEALATSHKKKQRHPNKDR